MGQSRIQHPGIVGEERALDPFYFTMYSFDMPRVALSSEAIAVFRDELIAVATRRFAEAGYAGVTLRGLASELGVSPMGPSRAPIISVTEISSGLRARL